MLTLEKALLKVFVLFAVDMHDSFVFCLQNQLVDMLQNVIGHLLLDVALFVRVWLTQESRLPHEALLK
jgi:hypothetical protein